jgi:hypothetical protein
MPNMTTAALRREYDPPKTNKGALFIPAYKALDAVFRRFAYEVDVEDSGAYAPRPITGGKLLSIHAYGPGNRFTWWNGTSFVTAAAVDINWNENPYSASGKLVTDMSREMVDAFLEIRTNDGDQLFAWGGDWTSIKDTMHIQLNCTKRSLMSGIAPATLPPSTTRVMHLGSNGPGVGFYQAMLNIMAPYRINAKGKSGGKKLPINKDFPEFGPMTEEATRELQRYMVNVWAISGRKGPKPSIDGVAGPQVFTFLSKVIPLALAGKL